MVWRPRLLSTLLLAMLGTSCLAKPPTQDAFIADMKRRLQRNQPGIQFTSAAGDPLSLNVSGDPEREGDMVNLHRIFGYCQTAEPADCEEAKAEFAKKITLRPNNVTTESLRIIVRNAEYLDSVVQYGREAKEPFTIVYKQIGDDLFAILASDMTEAVALVRTKDLKLIGLSSKGAWAQGWEQTRKALPPLPAPKELKRSAILFEDHEYGSTLLVDLKGWAGLAKVIGPDLFVTAVADHFVYVGTMADGPVLDKFAKAVAEDCQHQQRCISPHVYRFREGRWIIAR